MGRRQRILESTSVGGHIVPTVIRRSRPRSEGPKVETAAAPGVAFPPALEEEDTPSGSFISGEEKTKVAKKSKKGKGNAQRQRLSTEETEET